MLSVTSLTNITNIACAPMIVHSCVQEVPETSLEQTSLTLASTSRRGKQNEEQLVCSWVTTTEDCRVVECGREIVACNIADRDWY